MKELMRRDQQGINRATPTSRFGPRRTGQLQAARQIIHWQLLSCCCSDLFTLQKISEVCLFKKDESRGSGRGEELSKGIRPPTTQLVSLINPPREEGAGAH